MIERAAYDALRVALRFAIQLWPLWLFWFVWSLFDDGWRDFLLTFPDRSTQSFSLAWHAWPAVALFGPILLMAAAIGVPDPVRTETIKAFVIVKDWIERSVELEEEIRSFVREHLAKHEVPRAIEFVDALPMTTTGKIQRRKLREAERGKLAGV